MLIFIFSQEALDMNKIDESVLKNFDKEYWVSYNPKNNVHHQIMVWDNKDVPTKDADSLSISEAYTIAKKNKWSFSTTESFFKDTYLICDMLNSTLDLYSNDMEICTVVAYVNNKAIEIKKDMTNEQKYARIIANRALGFDKSTNNADMSGWYAEQLTDKNIVILY